MHQKQPVPKVAVSIFSVVLTSEALIALYLLSDVQAKKPIENKAASVSLIIVRELKYKFDGLLGAEIRKKYI